MISSAELVRVMYIAGRPVKTGRLSIHPLYSKVAEMFEKPGRCLDGFVIASLQDQDSQHSNGYEVHRVQCMDKSSIMLRTIHGSQG